MTAPAAALASSPPAIRVAGLRKRFRKVTVRGGYDTLKSSVVQRLFSKRRPRGGFLQVLDGIDLEVPRGTTLGLVGRNGSGKSTLLKILAGIVHPDEGTVTVNGTLAPLIELGAGFHPEFSGRENVALAGLVLGMTRRQVAERFESIVAFADLADSIDDPVRTYSSGMYMRLAFSVAVHVDPDVLLIDEVLAVGDEAFVAKCYQKIAEFQAAGKTIVLVSHDAATIERWCHEAAWLHDGKVAERGYPPNVLRRYHALLAGEPSGPPPGEGLRDSRHPGTLRAAIELIEPPARIPHPTYRVLRALAVVENRGDTVWRARPPTDRGLVSLSGRIFREGRLVAEAQRSFLPRDVYPGERVVLELLFTVPEPGRFRVELDMVDEQVCWFAERGSPVTPLELEVAE